MPSWIAFGDRFEVQVDRQPRASGAVRCYWRRELEILLFACSEQIVSPEARGDDPSYEGNVRL